MEEICISSWGYSDHINWFNSFARFLASTIIRDASKLAPKKLLEMIPFWEGKALDFTEAPQFGTYALI